MKQRILSLAAAACLLLSLAACGGGQQASPDATEPAQTTAPAAMITEGLGMLEM